MRVSTRKKPSKSRLTQQENYIVRLYQLPPPGKGCHTAMMGVADCGLMARVDPETIFEDIRRSIRPGARTVPDSEIRETIVNAQRTLNIFAPAMECPSTASAPKVDLEKLRKTVLAEGGGEVDMFSPEFRATSPIPLPDKADGTLPLQELILLLRHLYEPEERIFIGQRQDCSPELIRPAADWVVTFEAEQTRLLELPEEKRLAEIQALGDRFPHICPNPLSGKAAQTRSGDKMTYRGDRCVSAFKYIVAECDSLPLPQQGALIQGLCARGAEIAAIIHSGGKSCHAWLRCDDINNLESWNIEVKNNVFIVLGDLGFDRACSNPSRLSRTPGMFRPDKGIFQRLLYLSPKTEVLYE